MHAWARDGGSSSCRPTVVISAAADHLTTKILRVQLVQLMLLDGLLP